MLKYVTALCVVATLCAGAPQQYKEDVETLRFELDVQAVGYAAYETSDGTSGEEEGSLDNPGVEDAPLTINGKYSYTDPDGEEYTVKFTNGPNGLQQTINEYETSDGTSGEQEGSLDNPEVEDAPLTINGKYSYIDPDGVEYTVKFTNGPNGLQQTINEDPYQVKKQRRLYLWCRVSRAHERTFSTEARGLSSKEPVEV